MHVCNSGYMQAGGRLSWQEYLDPPVCLKGSHSSINLRLLLWTQAIFASALPVLKERCSVIWQF